ncbi:MAG: CTAG/PCC1 family protein [Thermoplasmata archaeon]|nr:CTAG/PCC1 family protein [Thermoplasmata archaeon]
MTAPEPGWTAVISVRLPRSELATWLEQALSPEAAREVPRAHAEIRRGSPDSVEIALTARDTGAVRAAMNTYLGWVHLALATVAPAAGGAAPSPKLPP